MKIIADSNIPFVKEAFAEFGVVITAPGREITKKICEDATILLVRSVTKVDEMLLDGTSVKFVATATIGTDHIDTAYLSDQRIGFASAPGSNADSVAEYIISALLHLENIGKCTLKDCTLGIIGVGNVGSRVFKLAQPLGVRCLLNDPPKKRLIDSDIYLPLDVVLQESDIVSIHVPLTGDGPDKTYHMVNEDFLNQMKNGTILINTSRGKVVDEALVCQLATKKLKGMVIDVWENEPSVNIDMLNLADITTAHIAGYSYIGKLNGIKMIHEAACAFFYKDKKWQIENIIKKLDKAIIDLEKLKKPVYDAVQTVYPIMKDDEKLRKILKFSEGKQKSYFEELRRTYQKRLEFPYYRIKPSSVITKDSEVLIKLGFARM